MNPRSLEIVGRKIFRLGVSCPKTSKLNGARHVFVYLTLTSWQPPTSTGGRRTELFTSTLQYKNQGVSKLRSLFCTTYLRFRSYRASISPFFAFLPIFFPLENVQNVHFCVRPIQHTWWPKKTGPACFIANILKTPRPNCVEVGEILQYCMLNAVITFLFKSFVALWRHLAKNSYCVMLKSVCTMLINDSSISIEFTENKITVTVEISESHSL